MSETTTPADVATEQTEVTEPVVEIRLPKLTRKQKIRAAVVGTTTLVAATAVALFIKRNADRLEESVETVGEITEALEDVVDAETVEA